VVPHPLAPDHLEAVRWYRVHRNGGRRIRLHLRVEKLRSVRSVRLVEVRRCADQSTVPLVERRTTVAVPPVIRGAPTAHQVPPVVHRVAAVWVFRWHSSADERAAAGWVVRWR
jgi:hypothetical protein